MITTSTIGDKNNLPKITTVQGCNRNMEVIER